MATTYKDTYKDPDTGLKTTNTTTVDNADSNWFAYVLIAIAVIAVAYGAYAWYYNTHTRYYSPSSAVTSANTYNPADTSNNNNANSMDNNAGAPAVNNDATQPSSATAPNGGANVNNTNNSNSTD